MLRLVLTTMAKSTWSGMVRGHQFSTSIERDVFGNYAGPSESQPTGITSGNGKPSRPSRPRGNLTTAAVDSGDVFGTLAAVDGETSAVRTGVDVGNDQLEYGEGRSGRPVTIPELEKDAEEAEKLFADEPEIQHFVVKKHSPEYFHKLQRKLGEEGKIAEMIAVLDKRMLEDRVRPTRDNFSQALTFLGRHGQPRKAFELYKRMLRMGIKGTPYQRATLFNACANCSPVEKEWALNRTKLLLTEARGQYGALNPSEYHAAIKAFARHGELGEAFRIADLMVMDRVKPDIITFTSLLQACVSDPASGFKLALDIWRAMDAFGIKADEKFYNTFLRACRDCGLGGSADRVVEQLEQQEVRCLTDSGAWPQTKQERRSIVNSQSVPSLEELSEKLEQLEMDDEEESNRRTQLAHADEKKSTVASTAPQTNFKLALLGGMAGVLNRMGKDRARPNVKTFALLLDLTPLSNADEEDRLTEAMRKTKIAPDVDFLNALIARRCRRRRFESALELLSESKKYDLKLNQRTFCSLAIGCRTRTMGISLLRDMEAIGLKPNIHVLTPLLARALSKNRKYDFFYAMSVMSWFKKCKVEVTKETLRYLEQRRREAEDIEEQRRMNELKGGGDAGQTEERWDGLPVVRGLKEFQSYYEEWLRQVQLKDTSIDPKLTLLDKRVTADDVREDWEKPWVAQAQEQQEMEEMERAKMIPVA